MDYAKLAAAPVPQTQPLPGREAAMERNDGGGFGFKLDVWERLRRFLFLGTEGGTYYVDQQAHTLRAFACVTEALKLNGERLALEAGRMLSERRVQRADACLFVLGMCSAKGDAKAKEAAYDQVAGFNIATHVFKWAQQHATLGGGFSSGFQRAVRGWYMLKSGETLALQATKYRTREGWSHLDMMRLMHLPRLGLGAERDVVLSWVRHGSLEKAIPAMGTGTLLPPDAVKAMAKLQAFEKLQAAKEPEDSAALIRELKAPREWVRSEHLAHAEVWDALAEHMPPVALFRNLGALGARGILKEMSAKEALIVYRLKLAAEKVHPVQVLLALGTYGKGSGMRGKLSWPVNARIVQALERAWEIALGKAGPIGKKVVAAADISKSMDAAVLGLEGISCRKAACALGLWLLNQEPSSAFVWFDTECHRAPAMNLSAMLAHRYNPVATDCAQPMVWALKEKIEVDLFVVITDNETWAGKLHPSEALVRYRDGMKRDAKLVSVALSATPTSIADPTDANHLNVVGLDAGFPALVREFANVQAAAPREEEPEADSSEG